MLRCYWRTVPQDLDVGRVQLAYNHGSHHLDIYTVDYPMPEGDFDCSKAEEWGNWPSEVAKGLDPTKKMPSMVVGFQNESVDWKLPDGISYHLKGTQQLLIQSHFANVASQHVPTARLFDLLNFEAVSGTGPQQPAETLFDEDTDLFIRARSTTVVTRYCDFPQEVNLIGMFGHFHSRGTSFEVNTYDPVTNQVGPQIYKNTNWESPPWYTPDVWGKTIQTKSIKMVARYTNTEDRDITWGYFVQQNEHFETYAMFYPRLDLDPATACHRPRMSAVTSDAPSIPPGKTCNVTVNMGRASAGDTVVTLAVDPPTAGSVPATVTVPADQLAATFVFSAAPTAGAATVTAHLGQDTQTTSITVAP